MKENCIQPAEEAATQPLLYQMSPRHRILVVDDDSSVRQFNTVVLLHAGYEVNSAEDGAIAWETLLKDSYDLLVTDNNMPNVTGVELLKKVRAAGMILPVIMATGTFPSEEFTRQPWLKPAALLLKPYPIAELVRTVKKVLREADCTGEGVPLFKHRDIQASRWEAPASAADPCELPCAAVAEPVHEENNLATGRGSSSSGATSPSFEVAH
jgi:DNA-binding response OmpR family regulator